MIPLHEIVLNYKMEMDSILSKPDTAMGYICQITRLGIDYGELLKNNSDITLNDIDVMRALAARYLINIET